MPTKEYLNRERGLLSHIDSGDPGDLWKRSQIVKDDPDDWKNRDRPDRQ